MVKPLFEDQGCESSYLKKKKKKNEHHVNLIGCFLLAHFWCVYIKMFTTLNMLFIDKIDSR